MARTAIIKGFLDRIGIPVVKSNTWSVVRIERMLKDLGITRYEFDYEPKVVKLASEDELMTILRHTMPSALSNDPSLSITQIGDKAKLRIGNWMFEAKA